MKIQGCVLLVGGSPGRGVRTLIELCNQYGNITVVELVKKLVQSELLEAV